MRDEPASKHLTAFAHPLTPTHFLPFLTNGVRVQSPVRVAKHLSHVAWLASSNNV